MKIKGSKKFLTIWGEQEKYPGMRIVIPSMFMRRTGVTRTNPEEAENDRVLESTRRYLNSQYTVAGSWAASWSGR